MQGQTVFGQMDGHLIHNCVHDFMKMFKKCIFSGLSLTLANNSISKRSDIKWFWSTYQPIRDLKTSHIYDWGRALKPVSNTAVMIIFLSSTDDDTNSKIASCVTQGCWMEEVKAWRNWTNIRFNLRLIVFNQVRVSRDTPLSSAVCRSRSDHWIAR